MRFSLHLTSLLLLLAIATAAIIPAPVPAPAPAREHEHEHDNNDAAMATGGAAARRDADPSAQIGIAPPVCWCKQCTYTCCTEAWCWDQGDCYARDRDMRGYW
ncbi:hypothetical protein F5X99DRAFT_406689 [Biscogniauxia marginata]|nr:hypothetical protein F5X99DRAFT_406689 [Biscogniauxia marginata]